MCADGHDRLQANACLTGVLSLSCVAQEVGTPTTKINNPMEGDGESDEGQDETAE